MLIKSIILFLGLSVLLYCLLAGADFGAGILEFFSGKTRKKGHREITNHALGPVWEANHVWLILAVVILFNAFPRAFSQLAITFHIPLTVMLVGIIIRGCAFTFRYYDVIQGRSQQYYSAFFILSSFLTSFTLGVIAAGMALGRVNPKASGYWALYIYPWFNVFSLSMGIFICALFAFLASVYLIAEAHDPKLKSIFILQAKIANLIAIAAGIFVFVAAKIDGLALADLFFQDRGSLACMVIATCVWIPLWSNLASFFILLPRLIVALQITLIFVGWFKIQFPILIAMNGFGSHEGISLIESAAPPEVLWVLLYSLLVGSALIFPALFYLLKIFKLQPKKYPPSTKNKVLFRQ